MAPRGSKGKTPDRSTAWSTFDWDPRGFWVATRLDANGRVQYDYRYPEGAQAAQDQQNTPRSPGPNVFNTADIQYSTTTSTNDTDYGNYGYAGSENNDVYITSNDSVSSYAKVSEYDVPSTSTTGGTFRTMNDVSVSDPESVSTVRYSTATTNPSYVVSPTYSIAPQPPEDTKACVTQSFGDLTITNTSTSLQQAYATTEPQDTDRTPNISALGKSSGKLDPRYKVIDDKRREKKQPKFWIVGRVFMVLWTEPAGQNNQLPNGVASTTSSQFSKTYLDGTAFSEIRRYVVVGEGHGNTICSPIHTYNGQATLKHNLPEPSQHAIIYTSDHAPAEHWYKAENGAIIQEHLSKDPISVIREQEGPEGDLDPLSRLNYSKIYTVEKNVRVLNIGRVADASMSSLLRNTFVKQRDSPIERPRNNPRRTISQNDDNKGKVKGKGKEKERK